MEQDDDECFYSYNVYIYVYFIEEVGLLIDQDDEWCILIGNNRVG